MRIRLLCALIWTPLLAACSGDTPAADSTPTEEPLARDAFLDWVPAETPITVRMPRPSALDANPRAFDALLKMLGRAGRADETFYGIATHEPLAADRSAGLAVTRSGAWVRYLPAANKSGVASAVGARTSYREEGSLILFSDGAMGGGTEKGGALPRGDLAVRFRFHPLLAALSHPTDQLELGFDVAANGFRFHGTLRPGKGSSTREAIAAARTTMGGTIEMLPAWLGLRVETTLPPTLFAEFLAHRLALHTGILAEDKNVLIRFMRELLTAVDPETGFAFGIEFKDGKFSFVATGQIVEGPPSRVLRRLSIAATSEFGAMVFHPEESDIKGLQGYYAWVAEAEPSLDHLPETAWEMVRGLADRNAGLPLAYAESEGRFVVAGGPRGDHLAATVLKRLNGSAERAKPGWVLHDLRKRHEDFVLGVVVNGPKLSGMAPSDRAALRRIFGATPEASAPAFVALAGFRDGETLLLEGKAGY